MDKQFVANVRQVPSKEASSGEFQTFDLVIPQGRHWQVDGNVSQTLVFVYKPTNDELRSIVAAAQGELNRRRDNGEWWHDDV